MTKQIVWSQVLCDSIFFPIGFESFIYLFLQHKLFFKINYDLDHNCNKHIYIIYILQPVKYKIYNMYQKVQNNIQNVKKNIII